MLEKKQLVHLPNHDDDYVRDKASIFGLAHL